MSEKIPGSASPKLSDINNTNALRGPSHIGKIRSTSIRMDLHERENAWQCKPQKE